MSFCKTNLAWAVGISSPRPINAEQATRAVFHVLQHYVDPGEIEEVMGELPTDLKGLWPPPGPAEAVVRA
jgi:uncharacterized protein (DUF2267 family)